MNKEQYQKLKEQQEKEFVEKGANFEHERWARWQKYMFSFCINKTDGSLIIPADKVARWTRQIRTAYYALTDEEKESDKKEARTYLPLLDNIRKETIKYERKRINEILVDELLIKCECEKGDCKNCNRLCKLLNNLK